MTPQTDSPKVRAGAIDHELRIACIAEVILRKSCAPQTRARTNQRTSFYQAPNAWCLQSHLAMWVLPIQGSHSARGPGLLDAVSSGTPRAPWFPRAKGSYHRPACSLVPAALV